MLDWHTCQICYPLEVKLLLLLPEDHWSCIVHLSAEDILKTVVFEEKKFNIALG